MCRNPASYGLHLVRNPNVSRIYTLNCTLAQYYRKIHYLTKEFRVKLHAKTDIARIAKR